MRGGFHLWMPSLVRSGAWLLDTDRGPYQNAARHRTRSQLELRFDFPIPSPL